MLCVILIVICCLQTVVSEECNETEIIVGQLGEELEIEFTFSDLKDEYNKYINEQYGKKIIQNEIQNKDLKKNSYIQYKKKMNSPVKDTIYRNGKSTYFAESRTEIFTTNDAFIIKITKVQQEDAGIYWMVFKYITLGLKALIITGTYTIKARSPQNPILKPDDNYTSTIQLECHSVSTSIGDCQPVNYQIYTVWYRNDMRMIDVDPSLSQINVTVDHNGGNFTCLVTDDLPCYQRLNTTEQFDDECNEVFDSETFIVQPEYPPIDVKLEPDQRKIVVNKNEDLLVKCSAKCHPKCEIRWDKELQVLKSSGSIFITENITENMYEKYLKIVNINRSHEGFYVCLIKNIHKESKDWFTLSVTETEENAVNSVDSDKAIIITLAVLLAVIVVGVIIVVVYKKYQKKKYTDSGNGIELARLNGNREPEASTDYNQTKLFTETMLVKNGKPEVSNCNNSKNGDRNRNIADSEV